MPQETPLHRKSIRLAHYDYSRGGLFFLTVCSHKRLCVFGEVEAGIMHLNRLGRIVEEEWLRSLEMRTYLDLDAYVVMPNHIHGLVAFADDRSSVPVAPGEGARSAPLRRFRRGMQSRSLASFVAGFKAAVASRAARERPWASAPVWQRNYYEYVVRDGRALQRIRDYVAANPARWEEDGYHPARRAGGAP